eukprot:GAFH01001817.1.p5 GENE.GAFH01001817.1~~GAFH01001817.1.p5  ORF type:complete len:95 (-),score=30.89 GAFH01001817.1:73-357(-)
MLTILHEATATLLAVGREQTLVAIRLPSLETHWRRSGNMGEVIDARFIGDEEVLVASNADELRRFTISSQTFTPLLGHTDTILSLDVSPDAALP